MPSPPFDSVDERRWKLESGPLGVFANDYEECGLIGPDETVEVVPATERDRLREGLLACATAAGEDVSDGIPTSPDVVEWAARAVRESRQDDEAEINRLRRISEYQQDEIARLRGLLGQRSDANDDLPLNDGETDA